MGLHTQMPVNNVKFPLYKLRAYLSIDTSLLGLVKVKTVVREYILDDHSIKGDFATRRLQLIKEHEKKDIYKLKEKILYIRQLCKYNSGKTFIDSDGNIIKYKKSSKLFKINSAKIIRRQYLNNWTIIHCENINSPFILGEHLSEDINYASIMNTNWGPFLYDITKEKHNMYRRKI